MAKGFNIRAFLSLDTKRFQSGLNRANRQAKGLSGSISGLGRMMRGLGMATAAFGMALAARQSSATMKRYQIIEGLLFDVLVVSSYTVHQQYFVGKSCTTG